MLKHDQNHNNQLAWPNCLAVIFSAFYLLFSIHTAHAQTVTSSILGPGMTIEQPGAMNTALGASNSTDASGLSSFTRSQYGTYEQALVKTVITTSLDNNNGQTQKIRYEVEIQSGSYKGKTFPVIVDAGDVSQKIKPERGDRVIVFVQTNPSSDNPVIFFESYDRYFVYWSSVFILILLLFIFAGFRGFKMAISITLILWLITSVALGMFAYGWPLLVTLVLNLGILSAAILILSYGWHKKTFAAWFSSLLSIFVTWILALAFIAWGRIDGLTNLDIIKFFLANPALNSKNLLALGVSIAAFGIILDLSASISCGLAELKQANPEKGPKNLFASGMRIGRDQLSTAITILPLALFGSSTFIFLTRFQDNSSFIYFLNRSDIAQVFLLCLSGIISIILSIPIAALINSLAWTRNLRKNDPLRTAMSWRQNNPT